MLFYNDKNYKGFKKRFENINSQEEKYNILIIIFWIVKCNLKITKAIRDKSNPVKVSTNKLLLLTTNIKTNTTSNPNRPKLTRSMISTLTKRKLQPNSVPSTCTGTTLTAIQIKSSGTLVSCFPGIISTLKASKRH